MTKFLLLDALTLKGECVKRPIPRDCNLFRSLRGSRIPECLSNPTPQGAASLD